MGSIYFNESLINKWLHEPYSEHPLNAVGFDLLRQARYRLALLVFTESLRINFNQPDIHHQIIQLSPYVQPEQPASLPEDSCMVSVIMRTRSRTEEIRESIQSVLDQSLSDLELIVINDGGTDVIGDIVASFESPRTRYFKLPENQGPSGAMNAGLIRARGRYISYLDDDDIFYPNHLETLVSFLESHSQYAAAYSNAWWCYGSVQNSRFVQTHRKPGIHPEKFDKELFYKYNWIVPNTLVYRRDVLRNAGLFNNDIWYSEDWEHFLRMAQRCNFHQLPVFTTEYRWKQDNASHKKHLMDFHSTMIFRFYQYKTWDLILLRDSILKRDLQGAKALFDSAMKNYGVYNQRPSAITCLFQAQQILARSHAISSNRQLITDYLRARPGDCIKQLGKEFQLGSLLRLMPQVAKITAHKIFKNS